ncbi:regulatory protein GemA [Variovorax sp. PAMC26660]|uniref:regulatory protein GemA n=1 Tax=Variovorax sp. PAMC26660 TaxID=2762322 RepID=UPI00164D9A2E|nr:regulatory protein GemA [Variovorax sp. PAMC26660]QNK69227.1 regulatory protein GemA [Variovorax sp. PAMC26660]
MSAERLRLIKLIHVARRDLEKAGKMDEPTYRTMLQTAGGADSAAKMGVPALMRVLEQAKKAGFKVRSKVTDRRQDTSPEARKVRALWLFLHELQVVRDSSETALASYVKRIAHVEDMHFADSLAMRKLIESMKKWAMRFLPAAVDQLQVEVHGARVAGRLDQAQEQAVEEALRRLLASDGFDAHWAAWTAFSAAIGRSTDADMQEALGGR